MLLAAFALAGAACSMQQAQQTIVVVQVEPPPAERRVAETISLGATPGDLNASQINAALAGHGTWSDSPTYGRMWRPDERLLGYGNGYGGSFTPYLTGGSWAASDRGWYWQSDYAWGRVAFHYGRWVLDGSTWWWVPGSRFAPAWVRWRSGHGWVAWTPMAPRRAREWSPFVYCPHASLAGAGLPGRVVQGAAGSSLYARTMPLDTADEESPRGPELASGADPITPIAQLWRAPVLAPPVGWVALAHPAAGVDVVEPVPTALVPDEAEPTPLAEASRGGSVVRITDRDLAGLSAGPSVSGAGLSLVPAAPVSSTTPTRTTTVVIPSATSPRVASAAPPPPLPPPPDGVVGGPYFGAYPVRGPVAMASRRAAPTATEAPVLLVAPPQAAAPAPTRQVGYGGGTGWRGGYQPTYTRGPGPTGLIAQ